ncbi:MAG: alpha-glucuronidase [Bacillus sp. (in: Bacteria)]|nr:alpha-glucuronidase [Bacillus sp. (in: firmicutes)]
MARGYIDNGYDCWLRYKRIDDFILLKEYQKWFSEVVFTRLTPIIQSALDEIYKAARNMLGIRVSVSDSPHTQHFIVLGLIGSSPFVDDILNEKEKVQLKEEGFVIKTVEKAANSYILVAGKSDKGILYGVYKLLQLMIRKEQIVKLNMYENPRNLLRIINHWDNIDGSIERGYAGRSIFYRNNRIIKNYKRIRDYARLLSSIGINGVVINNVNVKKNEIKFLTSKYLSQIAEIAAIFRSYGIKVFLSVNFASPIYLGELTTADPSDAQVKEWWKNRVAEIYSYIPDFGGFLVKADSEFNPGPSQYGRSQADGANMLAEALEPFGGIVIWRCFVYKLQDWRDTTIDRARAAYDVFKPLDGMFKENVVLQIKNGPMDFQVREPVSPLFGALEGTNQMLELQITQEYTGQQIHLCYLVPMWKEVLEFDTYAKGKGSTVKVIIDGSLFNRKYGGIAGISNIGDDPNWTGHHLAQANLYGFGRLAWNPDLSVKEITEEWIKQTFSNDRTVIETISEMLLSSWRIYEKYTAPLGIGWMVKPGSHYGPDVDGYEYEKWGTYHRADCFAIGVNRSVKSGTGFVGQYRPPHSEMYESIETCPEELLLFFHRVPYTYRLKSGKTLIQHIYDTHFEGVEEAKGLKERWLNLKGKIDNQRFKDILKRLEMQIEHAKEWRDVINTYFYRLTGIGDEKGRKIYHL